jgi:UDP-4-amino-4,6-dideoxy-N-acetyl-beta-L-altrosamine transaminase
MKQPGNKVDPAEIAAVEPAPTGSQALLPYGRHVIEDDDIAAVADVLRCEWLTTGPAVQEFESTLAEIVGAKYAVACSSGTAALYLAIRAANLKPGDAIVAPSITFVATANAAILAGIEVVFADVDPRTGLMSTEHVADALDRNPDAKVKAVCPVHLGGRVADPIALNAFATARGLTTIEDACHALATEYDQASSRVGACTHSSAACFSFHPVKTVAMGEGGAITTNSSELAARIKLLCNHGLDRDPGSWSNRSLAFDVEGANPWYYELHDPSHNLRASDLNCALGASQLRKLHRFVDTRRNLIGRYQELLAQLAPIVTFVSPAPGIAPGWHLCTVLIDFDALGITRRELMTRLKERGISTQVHYIPVHLQPLYRWRYGVIDLPGALLYYNETLTLPLFASMKEVDVERVVQELAAALNGVGSRRVGKEDCC